MGVTVIIPVKNEAQHLRPCLDSVIGWTDRVFVIDSGSDDETEAITKSYAQRGVRHVLHAYEGPADQKNWALDNLSITSSWVLFLDADERVTPRLAGEILCVTREANPEYSGYRIDRLIVWQGQGIRHGGWSPNWNLRLIRRGQGRYEQRRVHEHVVVDGKVGRLRGRLIHEDLRDITFQIAKHNRYSSDEASEYAAVLSQGGRDPYAKFWSRDPLARRRFIKTRIWARLPLKGALYFVWAYVFRLGFLDGSVGLRFHLMHAVFKEFDDLKLWELRRSQRPQPEAVGEGSDGLGPLDGEAFEVGQPEPVEKEARPEPVGEKSD